MKASTVPSVSIVTPTFNPGPLLRDTIESVLRQDHTPIDYIVVDGGSTDGTRAVLDGYGSRLSWISEPDSGQSSAINKGWRRTRGEVVAWLNADDTYEPDAIGRIARFFRSAPDVDAAYGNCLVNDESRGRSSQYPARRFDYAMLIRGASNYIPQPATFVRRKVLEEIGMLNENLHYVMDYEYWVRLGAAHRFAYLDGPPLATMRLHENAKSIRAAHRFGPELVDTLQATFRAPWLPLEIRRFEREALTNACAMASHLAFWAGHIRDARRFAWAGWRRQPYWLRRPFVLAALGKIALVPLARLRGIAIRNQEPAAPE